MARLRSDSAAAKKKFFENPVLVGCLLPYLDSGSTLRLVQSKISSCTLLLLTGDVEWSKLVQRLLPDDLTNEPFRMDRRMDTRVHVRTLISILKRVRVRMEMPAANSHNVEAHILDLLEVICKRGIPGSESRIKIKIVCPQHSGHLVSLNAFIMLEEVKNKLISYLYHIYR